MWNLKSLQKPLAILSMLCLFSLGAMAQGTVKGTVIDEAGEPVIGASVQVQGAKTGAVTDFNGNFSVQAASNATLLISYVGYVTETVNVNGRAKKMSAMIEDLKKAGIINEIRKRQLETWNAIRNSAAHGKIEEFTKEQVAAMLQGVQDFMAQQMK